MKNRRRVATAFLRLIFLATAPAVAQEPRIQESETKNEISVFGGVSILDASGSSEWAFGMGSFPDFPGFPGRIPDITVRGEGSLGSSALFGARYSRHDWRWKSHRTNLRARERGASASL